jgi:peptidoglycan hydrolase CwlO-like protein
MTPLLPNTNIAIWILSLVVGAFGVILWFSIRTWIEKINEKISEIMAELKVVGNKNVGFEKDISRLDKMAESHDKRMHDYSERIRDIEQKVASCPNCNRQ